MDRSKVRQGFGALSTDLLRVHREISKQVKRGVKQVVVFERALKRMKKSVVSLKKRKKMVESSLYSLTDIRQDLAFITDEKVEPPSWPSSSEVDSDLVSSDSEGSSVGNQGEDPFASNPTSVKEIEYPSAVDKGLKVELEPDLGVLSGGMQASFSPFSGGESEGDSGPESNKPMSQGSKVNECPTKDQDSSDGGETASFELKASTGALVPTLSTQQASCDPSFPKANASTSGVNLKSKAPPITVGKLSAKRNSDTKRDSDTDFSTPKRRRRASSSSIEGLQLSPVNDPVASAGGYSVVHVAAEFKHRKPGEHSAGIAIYWGDGHTCNESHPLRGKNLTPAKAQLTALTFVFKAAKRMKLSKLMIFANLTFVQKNLDNVDKWVQKNWCHGGGKGKGKGKPVANRDAWQKIVSFLTTFDIHWMWNPQGRSFQDVLQKASSMALLPTER